MDRFGEAVRLAQAEKTWWERWGQPVSTGVGILAVFATVASVWLAPRFDAQYAAEGSATARIVSVSERPVVGSNPTMHVVGSHHQFRLALTLGQQHGTFFVVIQPTGQGSTTGAFVRNLPQPGSGADLCTDGSGDICTTIPIGENSGGRFSVRIYFVGGDAYGGFATAAASAPTAMPTGGAELAEVELIRGR